MEASLKFEGVLGGYWVPDERHWRQGHTWHHEWPSYTPRKNSWKFHVSIFIRSVSRREASSMVVLGGHCGFLSKDMEDRGFPDIIYHLVRPQEWFPESFVLISWNLAELLTFSIFQWFGHTAKQMIFGGKSGRNKNFKSNLFKTPQFPGRSDQWLC